MTIEEAQKAVDEAKIKYDNLWFIGKRGFIEAYDAHEAYMEACKTLEKLTKELT